MVTKRPRKSIEQKIEEVKAKLIALEAAQEAKVKIKIKSLTKDSEGMSELIAAVEAVAKTHKINVPEVIKVLARIKRTGLKIENAVRRRKVE